MSSNGNKLRELYIEVGNKCYLRCKHCSSEAGISKTEFIKKDRLFGLIMEGKTLGANLLTISGGEPLLHPDIFEFARYANENGFCVKMYTCGVLSSGTNLSSIPEDVFTKLKDSGVNTLIFSLHGKPQTHDFITSIDGSYEIAEESIRLAVEFQFNVEIHAVPLSINYLEVPFIFDQAEKLGVKQVSLLRLVPQGRFRNYSDLEMSKEEHELFTEIVNNLNIHSSKARLGSPYSCLYPDRGNCCSAGKNKILIGPNGDAYPCEAFKTTLKGKTSTIYSSTLEDIWENDSMLNQIRAFDIKAVSNCNRCAKSKSCLGGCHGQRMIANSSLTVGPDPICSVNSGL